MTYLVVFNMHRYHQEKIRAANWLDFKEQLDRLVHAMEQPPDMIYMISLQD